MLALPAGPGAGRCRRLCWIDALGFGLTAGGVTSKTEGTIVRRSLAFNRKHIGNCASRCSLVSSVEFGELKWKLGTEATGMRGETRGDEASELQLNGRRSKKKSRVRLEPH